MYFFITSVTLLRLHVRYCLGYIEIFVNYRPLNVKWIAGPMVVWITEFLTYVPLTADGLALIIASSKALRLSTIF